MFVPHRIFSLCLVLMFVAFAEGYWWSLGTLYGNININQISLANHIQALSTKQQKLLNRNPYLIAPIALGARMAIMECQRQFRNRRWNCSSHSSDSVFGKILRVACRETAFAYAITAAGVSFALTRACSDGAIKGCQCVSSSGKHQTPEGWIYEGCHDNIEFGETYGRRFVDSRERGRDFRATVNMHNNEAGRMAARRSMGYHCKCTGVSGSCQVKICNRKLRSFRYVGWKLKEAYDSASRVQVAQIHGNGNRRRAREHKIEPAHEKFKPPTEEDLVYYEDSPNFCQHNLGVGSLGTKGRQCNGSSLGIDGCALLCCGRGYTSRKINTVVNCHCRFKWCCEVNCQRCKISKYVNICN